MTSDSPLALQAIDVGLDVGRQRAQALLAGLRQHQPPLRSLQEGRLAAGRNDEVEDDDDQHGQQADANGTEKNTPLRMLSIPAVSVLERHLLLYGADHPETAREAISVCCDLFGIEPSETEYEMPARYWTLSNYDPEKIRFYNLSIDYENQFETCDDLTDDETAEVLKRLGLDFSDDRGHPLRCTKLFSRVAEFAAKGRKGKLPDQGAIQLSKFEDSLKRQRDAYLANKRKRL